MIRLALLLASLALPAHATEKVSEYLDRKEPFQKVLVRKGLAAFSRSKGGQTE
jgi:hypothetical protein